MRGVRSLLTEVGGRLGPANAACRAIVLGVLVTLTASPPAALAVPTTTRVTISSAEKQASRGGGAYGHPWMSGDGRFVLFISWSSDLGPGGRRGPDLFVRDRRRETTLLVTPRGGVTGDLSGDLSISMTGRYVGFSLWNGSQHDAYIRDMRRRRTTALLPFGDDSTRRDSQSPAISRSGRFVAFDSFRDGSRPFEVLVRDRRRGTTRVVSRGLHGRPANGSSAGPAISADGRYIAFWSYASNLVLRDANRRHDVFVYDRVRRKIVWTTARADIDPSGSYPPRATAPAISANGRYVAFRATYRNLVEGDTNDQPDIFVHDRRKGTTQRVSVATGGRQVCVPPPRSWERPCHGEFALSPDGRFVAFISVARDLVVGDHNEVGDVFMHDTRTETTIRASVSAVGDEVCGPFSDDCISGAAVSSGGRFVAFNSTASTVVPDDTNRDSDVFVRGPLR
jgi:Tol biopolymer transport system component